MKPIGLQLRSLREHAKTKEDFANGTGRGIALGRDRARNGWDVIASAQDKRRCGPRRGSEESQE